MFEPISAKGALLTYFVPSWLPVDSLTFLPLGCGSDLLLSFQTLPPLSVSRTITVMSTPWLVPDIRASTVLKMW